MAHIHTPVLRPFRGAGETAPRGRSRVRRRLAIVVVAFMILVAVIYLGIGTYIALKLTAPDPQAERASPAVFALGYESPTIQTRDGIALASWFIPRSDSDRAVLLVHGMWTCRSCEFDGRFLELANHLHDAGYNILMIDLRKHGESNGEHITYGATERYDVAAAVDWLDTRGFSKIGVLGISLGAASTALAAADPAEGAKIDGLVLDSPFAEWVPTMEKSFTLETGLPTLLLPGAILMVRALLGVDLYSIRPVDALPKIKSPVMLIYGGQDKYISSEQMAAMEKARPGTDVWFVPEAGHTRIYNTREQEYVARVSEFFGAALR